MALLTILVVTFGAFAAYPLIFKLSNALTEVTFRHEPKAIAAVECFWCTVNLLLITVVPIAAVTAINAVILLLMLLLLVVQLLYYRQYGICLDINAISCLIHTHKLEAKEFIADKKLSLFAGLTAVLLATGVLTAVIVHEVQKLAIVPVDMAYDYVLTITVLCAVGIFNKKSIVLRTNPIGLIQATMQYEQYLQRYISQHAAVLQRTHIESSLPADFGTVLVVIGESANRQHMKAFNANYDRETTPWLSQMLAEDNTVLLKNSFSTFPQTIAALSFALTSYNQYNGQKLEDSISIVDIARASGFITYWYSNQGYVGKDDSFTSTIGSSADSSRWLIQDFGSARYDEALLGYLERIPQDGKNKFIVLHLKGSHEKYKFRYPSKCNVWDDKEGGDFGKNAYDNSILYTDSVLQKAFEHAKAKLKLQAMIYFSDHGAEIRHGRSASFTGLGNVRIPAFVWLADEYRVKYNETHEGLAKNAEQYFTNDLAFDLLGGIMQLKKSEEEKEYDICSTSYKINRCNALTNMGKTRICDCEDNNA